MKYIYMRVSTNHQEMERQQLILKEHFEGSTIFEEKISGTVKALDREVFTEMFKQLKSGDIVVFESMSRLGRTMVDIIETTNLLISKGISPIFIKEGMDLSDSTMGAMQKAMFGMMAVMSQLERDLIAERVKDALQAKKEAGIKLGRKSTISKDTTPELYAQMCSMYTMKYSINEMAEYFKVSAPTMQSRINEAIKNGDLEPRRKSNKLS